VSSQSELDSVYKYRELSRNISSGFEKQHENALKAKILSNSLGIDSTSLKTNSYLSRLYLYYDKYDQFLEINRTNLLLAEKLKDSLQLANTFYNLGWYHAESSNNDSAYYYYYNAQRTYQRLNDLKKEGEVLLNMASIQESAKDYVGSEETAVRAIYLIERLPKSINPSENDSNLDTLWSLYNLLAVISERLGQHDESIKNYQKCIEIAKKMSQPVFYILSSKNNIGHSIAEKGELQEALLVFQELIEDPNLLQVSPELYVHVLGNVARTKFKIGASENNVIEEEFKKAYRLSDSLNYLGGKMAILEDFSQFYFDIGRKDAALVLVKENYELAKESSSNDVALNALMLLSKIEGGNTGKEHLNNYIKLNDSLVKKEREARNKFARVRFQVDKIEADNKQLAKERLLFLIISIGLLVSLTLLYVVISQRARNRKLRFIQQQQETNEEIYNLMLTQQDKIKEGRQQEKKRISEELHDGVLGKLFGTRLSLDSLNLVNTPDAVKSRMQYINGLKTIEEEIRKISHNLNTDFIADSSFIDIISTLIETQTTAYGLEHLFTNDYNIAWEEVPNKTKIHIYRMLQETMQNIYKHAEANMVKISFELKNDVILCTIEDDGKGFNVSKARKGIGLKNIDSRVSDVGGKAEVYSKIDIGTIIKIHIPIALT
jgi:signal transduction histidine kinase